MPVVREVRAEQHHIARAERLDAVPDETGAGARLEADQLARLVKMPVLSLPDQTLPAVGGNEDLDVAQVLAPAQQPEGLPGGKDDLFLNDRHR